MINPTVLIILDGWGMGPPTADNAIFAAKTPNFDYYWGNYPHAILACSGEQVGLPAGQMGNSEVGHLNIGSGRIVAQNILRINRALKENTISNLQVFKDFVNKTNKNSGRLHLVGLISDGGVHSLLTHLEDLILIFKQANIGEIFIHAFTDGRDTLPNSGIKYINQLQSFLDKKKIGRIVSICGRYFAMDRDNRWDRIEKTYKSLVYGSDIIFNNPKDAINDSYKNHKTDEFIEPCSIANENNPYPKILDNDSILFFNFRADRMRELVSAFSKNNFTNFDTNKKPKLGAIMSMTQYDQTFDFPALFPPENISNVLGEVISQHKKTQLRIAETEKYAHVTYFFNGGKETPFEGEERILIPSPKEVPTYDLAPQMSALKITTTLLQKLDEKKHIFYTCNFANADMVGHTGNFQATIKACETVDECLKKIVDKVISLNGNVLITADHGNADDMCEDDGSVRTSHSLNPVPFIHISTKQKKIRQNGCLADIAPTILNILNLETPIDMTGTTLFEK